MAPPEPKNEAGAVALAGPGPENKTGAGPGPRKTLVGVHNLKLTFSMVMVVFSYLRFQRYEIVKYLLFAYKRMVFGYSKMILRRLYPIINHSRSAIKPSTIGFSLTNLLFSAIQKR